MAVSVVSCPSYPYRRENARFFSQELIEYVLFDFGHVWRPQRTKRERLLREGCTYIFTPHIGRLVAYLSRKHGGFVVMNCFNTWKYIVFHRPSVRERMLSNSIITFCNRSELESDDLGLFIFMAMMAEYARLAVTSEQENLIEAIINSLSYCLTDIIPGGVIATVERMKIRASNFEYPRTYVVCDYDPERPFTSPVSTDSVYTPRSEFESPYMYIRDFPPSTECNTPTEEFEVELNKREVHKEFFRRKMMVDRETQTDLQDDSGHLESMIIKSEGSEVVVKVAIKKDESSDDFILEDVYFTVERRDVCIQTSSFAEEQLNYDCPEDNKTKDECVAWKLEAIGPVVSRPVDLRAVSDRLRDIRKLQVAEDLQSVNVATDAVEGRSNKPHDGSCGTSPRERVEKSSSPTVMPQFVSKDKNSLDSCLEIDCEKLKGNVPAESVSLESLESLLQNVRIKPKNSEDDMGVNESFGDSQLESLDESCDNHHSKIRDDRYCKSKDESFDSMLGSLDESIKSSDESRLEK